MKELKKHEEWFIIIGVVLIIIISLVMWNGVWLNNERPLNDCTKECLYLQYCGAGGTSDYTWCFGQHVGGGTIFPTQDSCIKYCMAS